MKVSIIIPVYNEALAIHEVLRRVCTAILPPGWEKEVVVVDDGSNDATLNIIREFLRTYPEYETLVRVHEGLVNHGKGAALRAGFKLASGDVFLIQDGDLEYSPDDYPALLLPFENPEVQVVFGSRFHAGFPEGMKFLNLLANLILTATVRLLYGQQITDEATGYKVFHRSVFDNITLKCRGFEFCPEITTKVMRQGYKIHEVPIKYNPRGILEGKKIKAKDGFIALWWLIKHRFSNPQQKSSEVSRPKGLKT